jgi:hypothetical protein
MFYIYVFAYLTHKDRTAMHFLDENWGEVTWTSWVPFTAPSAFKQLPASAGMYRVRAVNGQELFYVGETGRAIASKFSSSL